MTGLPATIVDEQQLETLLSEPSPQLLKVASRYRGTTVVLGAGGKMGRSLCRMLRRALDLTGVTGRVIAVSRFTRAGRVDSFQAAGLETIAGDLLDQSFLDSLPEADRVVFMTGMKFGSGAEPARTWAMNVRLPVLVCNRYAGCQLMAFSTGNVYPLVPIESGGSREEDPVGPIGEYAMSALGRERMFEYAAFTEPMPIALVRLNYAVEMRYGVLVDLANQVQRGETIDLEMGYANVIWQGDANAQALCAMADAASPAFVANVAGPEVFSVESVCRQFAERFGCDVNFQGEAADTALLNNGARARDRYGASEVDLRRLIDWTADWLQRGMPTLSKPTHFAARDGRF